MTEQPEKIFSALSVKQQPRMSFGRTLSITVISIKYRFFRSLVTIGVITVAIAFLMNILTESVIKKSAYRRTSSMIEDYRMPALLTARYSLPDSTEESIQHLAAGVSDPVTLEYVRMAGLSGQDLALLGRESRDAKKYLDYFSGLEYNRRHRLVRDVEGIRIFGFLQDPGARDRFVRAFNDIKHLKFPAPLAEFLGFLDQWPRIAAALLKIQDGQAKAIQKIRQYAGDVSLMEEIARNEPAFRDALRSAGFNVDDKTAVRVSARAGQILETSYLESSVLKPEMRQAVAAYLDIRPTDVSVDILWKFLRNRQDAAWYLKTLRKTGDGPRGITPEDIGTLVKNKELELLLRKVEFIVGGETTGGVMNLGERMTWLILVSLLLCVVGISNAMLMSVTERFREIAVLKCLGALDGFIMLMFVLESCILGFFGGVAGSILGYAIATFRMLIPLGGLAVTSVPFVSIVVSAAASTILGILLSAIASVYPSFRAARLAPMEAMRVE